MYTNTLFCFWVVPYASGSSITGSTIGGSLGAPRVSRELPDKETKGKQMEDDFVDVFPSAGGVGDSPVKTDQQQHLGSGSPWPRPPISLSIPGLDTGGAAAAVSPAIPGSRGVATPSPAKEAVLRSARAVSGSREEEVTIESPAPSPHLNIRCGMAPLLTIDPGGEDCVPTELEKKRAKLEKYRLECSEVGSRILPARTLCPRALVDTGRQRERAQLATLSRYTDTIAYVSVTAARLCKFFGTAVAAAPKKGAVLFCLFLCFRVRLRVSDAGFAGVEMCSYT